jgi:hypothetical protein
MSAILALALLLPGFASPARAGAGVEVTNVQVSYEYGVQVTFTATVLTGSPIQEAYLIFQSAGDDASRIAPLAVAPDGTAVYTHQIAQGMLRPFASIQFWYRIVLGDGQTFTSPQYYVKYEDNRPPWQVIEDGSIRLHWYEGDMAFGQAAFDVAHRGLTSVAGLFPVTQSGPVDIYIYASAMEVQEALNLGGESWVTGHASPDLGVVLVSVAPGLTQGIEMERQIPHELSHVILYGYTGSAYERLPAWLREGLATQAELYPDPDYRHILDIAGQNENLIAFTDLCAMFPQDASGAILAYAESGSFVNYLRETHGTSGLQALIDAYADGLGCEQGAYRALGMPLSQLDLRWRQAVLGQDIAGIAFQNFAPYLILLAFVLIIPIWRIRLARIGEKEKKKDGSARPKR